MLRDIQHRQHTPKSPPEVIPNDSEQISPEPTPDSAIDQESVSANLAKGTVETFEYNELVLEVSNVKEISKGSSFDGMETWEYVVYVVYPGATINILNPDTFIDEESGLDHSSWAIYTLDDNRIDIEKNMKPLEITKDILGVFSTESSVYVLGFEIYEEP